MKKLIATLAIVGLVFISAPVWAQDYGAIAETCGEIRAIVGHMESLAQMHEAGQVDMGGIIIVFTPTQLQLLVDAYNADKAQLTTLYGQLP